MIVPSGSARLRATIEWSHDLLDAAAQAAFRRLSVFRGSFTLDAAEAVAGADLDQIAALLDQSLLKPLGDVPLLHARDAARIRLRATRRSGRDGDLRAAAHALLRIPV